MTIVFSFCIAIRPINNLGDSLICRQPRGRLSNLAIRTERSLLIPLPPLDVQREIMERVAQGRAEVARERERAERIGRESVKEIEALILGTKSLAAAS